jgi:hypothetical protein
MRAVGSRSALVLRPGSCRIVRLEAHAARQRAASVRKFADMRSTITALARWALARWR